MMHILHSSFYRIKNHYILCRKVKSPFFSDQSDLNIPDVVITTCQLVRTNVPEGHERSSERGKDRLVSYRGGGADPVARNDTVF